MKRSTWLSTACLLALGTVSPTLSKAADHRDGPVAVADATTDITDVYAWMSADGNTAYLVLDVQGANLGAVAATKFSNVAQYVLHVNSSSAYGMPQTADHILCSFDNATPQNFQCWGPGVAGSAAEYVKDAVGNTTGKMSKSGKMKVFAGYRGDPFWFNIQGFAKAGATVNGAAGALMFDLAGCPKIDAATETVLVNQLKSDRNAMAGIDDFGKNGYSPLPPGTGGQTNGNILSIVIAIDKTLLTKGGNMLSVWASTNK